MEWERWFYYDETSPTFLRWKVRITCGRNGNRVNCEVGDVAGNPPSKHKLHSSVMLDKRNHLAHRIIFEMFHGPLGPDDQVDHIDGNGWNNRISNLRKVTQHVNMRNCKKRVDNKSGVTGVTVKIHRNGTPLWVASWKSSGGRQVSKAFSTAKYGSDEAFRLACEYRARMIEELNAAGAGYTERHGT